MNSMVKKTGVVLLMVALLVVVCSATVYAGSTYSSMITTIDGKTDGSGAKTAATNIVGAILDIAKIIAVGVALIMLVVLAIKYMSAAPGDKAEIKKHAVVYVIGAIVLFAASGILGIVKNFAGNINDEGEVEAATE